MVKLWICVAIAAFVGALGILLLAALTLHAAGPQDLGPAILKKMFGNAPTSTDSSKIDQVTIRPTSMISKYQDGDGESCQCVPYYRCDADNAVNLDDPTLTGFGMLDIRFGEGDSCQESVERCCELPKIKYVPPPPPDPSRLRGCGFRNPKGLDFTISGTSNEAQFGEFPWVVAILDAANNSYYGVGVLIHPQVVMTAAHVVSKLGPGQLKIRAGEWDTQTSKERLQSQERLVDDLRIREDFFPKSLRNDVALLRLVDPVQLADHINVLCLPQQGELFDGYKDCVANGWGKDSFGRANRYAVILKKVQVDMVGHEACGRLLKATRLGRSFVLHESFVCAGGEEGKDTCTGDGGAPLACPVGDNQYKLAGLVAWSMGCGQKDVPAVYARVPLFRQWTDDVLAGWGLQLTDL